MNRPKVVTEAQWRVARDELLVKEKEVTRARDVSAAERRGLPMVRIAPSIGAHYEYTTNNTKPNRRARFIDTRHTLECLLVVTFLTKNLTEHLLHAGDLLRTPLLGTSVNTNWGDAPVRIR